MKYAFFPGCVAKTSRYACELSIRNTLTQFGVELIDLDRASCCGYPYTSIMHPLSWTYLTARNMALAEETNAPLLTLCNGCHLSFSEIRSDLDRNPEQKKLIDKYLAFEGLNYKEEGKLFQIIELFHDEIGVDQINRKAVKLIKNLRFASHPGCHSFRPKNMKRPDKDNPSKLENLIKALGGETLEYPEKLTCCGFYLSLYDIDSAFKLAGLKLKSVKENNLDGLVTTCPMCFEMLDAKQDAIKNMLKEPVDVPVFYYPQLLGIAIGVPYEKLGLHLNLSPVNDVLKRLR